MTGVILLKIFLQCVRACVRACVCVCVRVCVVRSCANERVYMFENTWSRLVAFISREIIFPIFLAEKDLIPVEILYFSDSYLSFI